MFQHIEYLRKKFWRSGVMISFPRICFQQGNYSADNPVDDKLLAKLIFAFRICFPDIPLVLSTREPPAFRDGMAGLGISRMSVASKTTVGGYNEPDTDSSGQFNVNDERTVADFCEILRKKHLEPVFKNWDSVFSKDYSAKNVLLTQ
jgi:2-iminoacetate synthase